MCQKVRFPRDWWESTNLMAKRDDLAPRGKFVFENGAFWVPSEISSTNPLESRAGFSTFFAENLTFFSRIVSLF